MSAVRTDGFFPDSPRHLVGETKTRGKLSATLTHRQSKPWEGILRFRTSSQEDEIIIKEVHGETQEDLLNEAVEFLRRRERDDIRSITLDGLSVRDVW